VSVHIPIVLPRRQAASLAAALLIAGFLLVGCGGSDSGGSGTTPTPAPASSGSRAEALTPLVECARSNGVDIPESPTRADLLKAFGSLSKEQRQKIRAACGSLAPSGLGKLLESASPS